MRSFTALLLLGVVPALSWVVPDDNNQQVFGKPQDRLNEVQGVFKALHEKFESRLESFVDELEEVAHAKEDVNDAEIAIDNAFEKQLDSQPRANSNFEFWDTDAWVGHFGASDLDGDEYTSTKKLKSKHQKHHKHHYHDDSHDDGDPEDGTDPGDGPPYHRDPNEPPHHTPQPPYGIPPVHRPKMPPRDHTGPHTNSTLWDLLSSSKHTSRFHEFLKDDKEIKEMLQDQKSNLTIFAPSNNAFEQLEKYHKKHDLPRDLVHRVLMYHLAPGTHQSEDLRYHNTLITKLSDEDLGKRMHQRVRIGLAYRGPSLNFYSQFTMFDIYGKNGVIHGIDAVLIPPPDILDLLETLPTEFSTTMAAFARSGLMDEIPKLRGKGLTVFAPSNRDWQKLGFKINAFLFSDCGMPYLRAIMKYHIVPDHSLYSDAVDVPAKNKEVESRNELDDPTGLHHGYSHVDLPTLLKDRHISVDITRLERFLSFRVNGLNSIIISDGLAKSGVIQVPDHVLIPPHRLREHDDPPREQDEETFERDDTAWGRKSGVYSVSQLKEILGPFVGLEQRELGVLRGQGMLRESGEL